MRHIIKQPVPEFFTVDVSGLTIWSQYWSTKKLSLKKFILDNEQFHVCCYCEKKIDSSQAMSHVEHVKPKSLDPENLTFDYNNLLVSCEGNHFNEVGDESKNTTCGQKKDSDWHKVKFLNPITTPDIEDHFNFEVDTGMISASSKNKVAADYTIKTLNLNGNNSKLAESRVIARTALISVLKNFNPQERQKKLSEYLLKNDTEFRTFLRYSFKK